MDSTPPSAPEPPPVQAFEPLPPDGSPNLFETDPLKVSLSMWQYWMIGFALLVLLGAGVAAFVLLPELEEKGTAHRIGFAFGLQVCLIVVPVGVLLAAQFTKQYSVRRTLLNVVAWLVMGLTLLYVPLMARAVIVTKATYRVKAAAAANEEVKKISAEVFQRLNDLTSRLTDAGSTRASTMMTLDSINDRLAMLAELREESERVLARIEELEARLNAALDRHGVSKAKHDEFWTNFNASSGGIPNIRKIHELDLEIVKHMEAYVKVLRDEFGHWRRSGEKVIFENSEAISAFNQEAHLINSLRAEEEALRVKRK